MCGSIYWGCERYVLPRRAHPIWNLYWFRSSHLVLGWVGLDPPQSCTKMWSFSDMGGNENWDWGTDTWPQYLGQLCNPPKSCVQNFNWFTASSCGSLQIILLGPIGVWQNIGNSSDSSPNMFISTALIVCTTLLYISSLQIPYTTYFPYTANKN